jgi:hypothetical protein
METNGHISEEKRPELLRPQSLKSRIYLFVFWFYCEYRHVENCYDIVRYCVGVCEFEMSIVTENKEHCGGACRRSVFLKCPSLLTSVLRMYE